MAGMNHGGAGTTAGPVDMGGMHGNGEYDQLFIDSMVPHHQAAIDMAQVACDKSEHPEIAQLAASIATSQRDEVATLKAWRKTWYGNDTIPAWIGEPHMAGMDVDLKQLATAAPFDKAFIDAMLPHHQSAVDMAAEAQTKATHPELKQLAYDIVVTQQREIAQMKAWRAQWYPGQ